MVQRACGSGSVPVSFMPAMLGCTKHPSVGTHGVRQSWAIADERIANIVMLEREQNLHSQRCMLCTKEQTNTHTYTYLRKQAHE